MEFCLLGPLAVRCGGTALVVPRGRQRAVLAALLLRANHVVGLDELAGVLWGADPPPSARVSVQNYVMRLRSTLGPAGSRIGTQPRGYLIGVGDGELDITRFEVLLRRARDAAREGRWLEAAGQAGSALALWRGEPLADAGSDVLAGREAPRLSELRMQATEIRVDADVHLGRHGEVIAELRQLAGAEPLRERLYALLMLALYRDSRQAEALAAYQHARQVLVDELGAEPGPGLQQLHQQILRADPALLLPGLAAPAASTATPAGPGPPRQLPAAVAGFAGRTAELAALTQILAGTKARGPGTVVISAVGGTAGVGKTALALHWAHQAAHQFPGGQLYVNLRGFDPSGTPATPETVIRGFLDALGVPPERIPPDPDAQAGLYRSLLADRQMLIVLDNTRDEQQVRPLLPASPGSLVLVTSRHQLSGLAAAEGAQLISLDMLSHDEAIQLLTTRLGHARTTAEPEALSQIATLCACLPLALAVAAARAAGSPQFPLAALAGELADSAGRLDALDAGDPAASVQAVFSWSHQQLSDQAARMFRLLGLHPGPDISLPAAASLTETTHTQARHLLRELARAHLITEHTHGRYTFHDLLRAYATTQAHTTDTPADRNAATGRVLDHYLHTATSAAFRLNPAKRPLALAAPRPGTAPEQPADYRQALAWFEAEHQVLLAAIALAAESGFDTQAWQIPWAMAWFLWTRGHWQESVATQRTALAAATRLGDEEAQALSASILGTACTRSGDLEEARGHFATSLTLYEGLGNRVGVAKVHQNISVLANRQGRYAEALGHAEQAVLMFHSIGDRTGEAEALNCAGWEHCVLGDYQKAREFCRQALTLAAEAGHRRIEPHAWDSLAYAEHHLGNFAEATACYQRALSRFRETGDRFTQAGVLTRLGDTHHAAGKLTQAREVWQEALAILEGMQHPDADNVRSKLADTNDHASRNP